MTTVSAIKAILEADSTLLATATGGVWDYDESGRTGINRTDTPAAVDSDGIIKPSNLVRLRSSVPDYIIADSAAHLVSTREMVELYFFEFSGNTNIEAMKARCFVLLHEKRIAG